MAVERAVWHSLSYQEVAERLGADPECGLTAIEAATRLRLFGPNELIERKGPSFWKLLLNQFSLELLVGQVLAELGMEANVSQVEDPRQIDRYALVGPPGLVINGQLVAERRLPTKEELHRWIADALS